MKVKVKKALLQVVIVVLTGIEIVFALLTQAGEISTSSCFIFCGLMLLAQISCVWKGGWWIG